VNVGLRDGDDCSLYSTYSSIYK